jgi:hypothetical protein
MDIAKAEETAGVLVSSANGMQTSMLLASGLFKKGLIQQWTECADEGAMHYSFKDSCQFALSNLACARAVDFASVPKTITDWAWVQRSNLCRSTIDKSFCATLKK